MIIAALFFLFGTAAKAPPADSPTAATEPPAVTRADDRPRIEPVPPATPTRTRAEVRAETIEAVRAARPSSDR